MSPFPSTMCVFLPDEWWFSTFTGCIFKISLWENLFSTASLDIPVTHNFAAYDPTLYTFWHFPPWLRDAQKVPFARTAFTFADNLNRISPEIVYQVTQVHNDGVRDKCCLLTLLGVDYSPSARRLDCQKTHSVSPQFFHKKKRSREIKGETEKYTKKEVHS